MKEYSGYGNLPKLNGSKVERWEEDDDVNEVEEEEEDEGDGWGWGTRWWRGEVEDEEEGGVLCE